MQLESTAGTDLTAEATYLGRILLVDDDTSVLRSLRKTLEFTHPDYLINCVESAEDALELLKHDDIDLLISDLKLPIIDGLSLVSLAHRERPRMRSILMTAYGSDEVLNEATESGCVAYLEKPFDLELLIHSVNTALSACAETEPNLAAVEVFELFGKSGVEIILSVCSRNSSGLVAMDRGFIRHAEFEGAEGLEALMLIVRHPSTSITPIRPGRSARQTLNLSANSLRALLGLRGGSDGKPRGATRARFGKRDTARHAANADDSLAIEQPDLTAAYLPGLDERRREITQRLVKAGLSQLRSSRHEEARQSWLKALEIDPFCAEATRNLAALDKVLKKSRK